MAIPEGKAHSNRFLEFPEGTPHAGSSEEGTMEVLYPRCAGLDVHKDTVVASARLAAGREVAERALAHVVRGVEGAYARSDLLEKRRPLMAAWAEWCGRTPSGAEVRYLAVERAR